MMLYDTVCMYFCLLYDQGITEYGIVAGFMLLSLFFLLLKVETGRNPDLSISIRPAERLGHYFQVAVCMAVEVLLPSAVTVMWGGWRESLLAHGAVGAVFVCSHVHCYYYDSARNLGGETARMRVMLLIVFFLLSLSVLLSAHYALGVACWMGAIIPVLSFCAVLPVLAGDSATCTTSTTFVLALSSMVTIGVLYSPLLDLALLNK